MIRIDKLGEEAPISECWKKLMQSSFKYLWSWDFEEKSVPHFPYEVSILIKLAFTSSNPSFEY